MRHKTLNVYVRRQGGGIRAAAKKLCRKATGFVNPNA
jgi:hypothetical protein